MVDGELVWGEGKRGSHEAVAFGCEEQVLVLAKGAKLSLTNNDSEEKYT